MAVKRFSNYPAFEKDAIRLEARVPAESIADLCRLMETYEGVAFVRTKDPGKSIVEFWVSPSFKDDFRRILAAIRGEIPIDIIEEDSQSL